MAGGERETTRKRIAMLEKAAEEPDADSEAMDNLGAIYESGEGAKQGVPQDYPQAVQWYTKAADTGDRAAMNNLGRLYYDGRGVPRGLKTASQWFKGAARIPKDKADCQSIEESTDSAPSAMLPDALFNLGRVYADREMGGDAASAAEARCWYALAAVGGHADAMVRLGAMYETGRGVEANPAKAIEWYEKAAKSNNRQAMFSVGSLYEAGIGVAADNAKALMWYARAAEDDAAADLDPYALRSILKLGALFDNGFASRRIRRPRTPGMRRPTECGTRACGRDRLRPRAAAPASRGDDPLRRAFALRANGLWRLQ